MSKSLGRNIRQARLTQMQNCFALLAAFLAALLSVSGAQADDRRQRIQQEQADIFVRENAEVIHYVSEMKAKGYSFIEVRDFAEYGNELAAASKKILMIGSYRRTPNGIEVLFPVKAIGSNFVMIPVDSSEAELITRNYIQKGCHAINDNYCEIAPIAVVGTATMCTSHNDRLGIDMHKPCFQVESSHELETAYWRTLGRSRQVQ
jgi:hypothetical protein